MIRWKSFQVAKMLSSLLTGYTSCIRLKVENIFKVYFEVTGPRAKEVV